MIKTLAFTLFQFSNCVIFKDSKQDLYLSMDKDTIVMKSNIESAIDINLVSTFPYSISSILSTGSKALSVNRNEKNHKQMISLEPINRNNRNEFIKVILTAPNLSKDQYNPKNRQGEFVFMFEDMCIGYSPIFKGRYNSKTLESYNVELVECNDYKNVIKFIKSSRIDGIIEHAYHLDKKIINTEDPIDRNHYELHLEDKGVDIGFMRDVYNRTIGHLI